MNRTPNFSLCRALVLHRADSNTEKLIRQLLLLGLFVEQYWEPLRPGVTPDIVIVDADQGWDGLLPWSDSSLVPCPIVAMLASEAPSRIEWALQHGAGAILAKPLNASAVYPALVMAHARHEERRATAERLDRLEEKLKLRPVVNAATKLLMERRSLSEDEAHSLLRTFAMRQRQPLEAIAAAVVAGTIALPEAG